MRKNDEVDPQSDEIILPKNEKNKGIDSPSLEGGNKKKSRDHEEAPSTPILITKRVKGQKESPFTATPPHNYQSLYNLSHGKAKEDPAFSPFGTQIQRRRNEGNSHHRLKPLLEDKTYYGEMRPSSIEEFPHVLMARLIDEKERVGRDIVAIRMNGRVEPNHLIYAKEHLLATRDMLLKVYLSCLNRDEYLAELNMNILQGHVHNPFSLTAAYKTRLDPATVKQHKSNVITRSDIESVLVEQMVRLKVEADKDYDDYDSILFEEEEWGKHAKQTVDFAKACSRKIAEWYYLLSEEERPLFLARINNLISQRKFYNPEVLVILYDMVLMSYNKGMASDAALIYKSILISDLADTIMSSSRKTFTYVTFEQKFQSKIETSYECTQKVEEIEQKDGTIRRVYEVTERVNQVSQVSMFASSSHAAVSSTYEDVFERLSSMENT